MPWYLKSVSHHVSGRRPTVARSGGKKPEERSFGVKEECLKRLKGKRQKAELCDLLSVPQSVGSAASDTFTRAAFELQHEI